MQNSRRLWIVPVVLICTVLIQLVYPLSAHFWGTEIVLHVEPYDPVDIFRGDYVRLDYAAERVPGALVDSEAKDLYDRDMYAVLTSTPVAEVSALVSEVPDNAVYLNVGRIWPVWRPEPIDTDGENPSREDSDYMVDFGMERYYVKENTGEKWEKAAREGSLYARVKVFRGYGIITELFVDE